MKVVKTFGRGKQQADAMIAALEQRGALNTSKVEKTVSAIVGDVRKKGDRALRKYAAKFDGLRKGAALQVSREEMQAAWAATAPELREAMQMAQANIRAFAEAQKPSEWMRSGGKGVQVGQVVRPLESVGCYVPGGRYPLPSTLLMTVTPAQVAGVARIVVCSPKPARETLAAAWLAGVTEFYRVGGAQAIAALAHGTETSALGLDGLLCDLIAVRLRLYLARNLVRQLCVAGDQDGQRLRVVLGLRNQVRGNAGRIAGLTRDDDLGWACGHVDAAVA